MGHRAQDSRDMGRKTKAQAGGTHLAKSSGSFESWARLLPSQGLWPPRLSDGPALLRRPAITTELGTFPRKCTSFPTSALLSPAVPMQRG